MSGASLWLDAPGPRAGSSINRPAVEQARTRKRSRRFILVLLRIVVREIVNGSRMDDPRGGHGIYDWEQRLDLTGSGAPETAIRGTKGGKCGVPGLEARAAREVHFARRGREAALGFERDCERGDLVRVRDGEPVY